MPKRFVPCDREQIPLLPPCLLEWLPQDHLAFFVIDAVAEMDLDLFYARYRSSNLGRPAYDPSMLLALLIYAYSQGVTSRWKIESACIEQVPFRVISADRKPDHVTIGTFRKDNEAESRVSLSTSCGCVWKPGSSRSAGWLSTARKSLFGKPRRKSDHGLLATRARAKRNITVFAPGFLEPPRVGASPSMAVLSGFSGLRRS